MKKGLKVEIEGTDGAGKTTALKYLIQQLRERGLEVLETREVGNPNIPVCGGLRELVLSPESDLSGAAMELIFSAMRIENERFYKSVGDRYDFIVSDRGWFSHLAYTDHNVSKSFTRDLYLNFMDKYTSMPDVVVYFSVNTETALKRRVKRGETMDIIEMKGVEYQELVRESFDKYLNKYENDVFIYVVDANASIEGVRVQINTLISLLVTPGSSIEKQVNG